MAQLVRATAGPDVDDETVAAIADRGPIGIEQDDTFFRCTNGRLKLRCFASGKAELIFYRRADDDGPKESFYLITPTDAPDSLRDTLTHASIIGSEFHGKILGETNVGGRPAILPSIKGSAWITGFHNYVVDPADPWPEGYVVGDTWGVTGAITQ